MHGIDLISLRRDLHRHAEPAFCEIRTACLIEEVLKGLPVTIKVGPEVQDLTGVGAYPSESTRRGWRDRAIASGADSSRADYFLNHGTAIIAVLEGSRPGPVWGLRVDIDALPITESDDASHFPAAEGFRATNGAMHACGHDCHATIGIGVLESLSDHDFPGTLKVVFQPAEEGVRGAQTILNTSAVDDVHQMLAIHVRGDYPKGSVVGSVEGGMATQKLQVDYEGIASHASAAPEQGRNALLAAAASALSIMALPRYSNADTRLNVGTLHAGDNVNIVPAHATMICEARADDDDVLLDLVERVRGAIAGTAVAYDVKATTTLIGSACTMSPDTELVERIVELARQMEIVRDVVDLAPMTGSDDAHLFIREVQRRGGIGAYINVGAESPAPHHNPFFDVDETCIPVAVDLLDRLIRS